MRHAFLFEGHGEGPGTVDLWLALADPRGETARAVGALEKWSSDDADVTVEHEGAVVALSCRRRAQGLLKSLEVVLGEIHAATPLALVVRTNRVKGSDWHEATLAQPDAVLDVLERHVLACAVKDYRALEIPLSGGQVSLQATAWEALEFHSPRGRRRSTGWRSSRTRTTASTFRCASCRRSRR